MKLHIIRLAIGFTALVASFLPQKAQAAFCTETCKKIVTRPDGSRVIIITHCAIEAPECSAKCVGGIATCTG